MAASQKHINSSTPMGANIIDGGTTFRVWANGAKAVYVSGEHNNWNHGPSDLLVKDENGYWSGFIPGIGEGTQYKFWVEGHGSKGYKRDPYARELTNPESFPGTLPFPHCNCVVCDPGDYPWHDHAFRPHSFHDLIIYQFHIGTFYAVDENGKDTRKGRIAKFLDVLFRIDYLVSLGVNAIQPLPVVEWPSEFSRGYNGVDYFSPEMDYAVPVSEIRPYLDKLNELLSRKGHPPVMEHDIRNHVNQLKALVDICHIYGLSVIFDVVYNHAGGGFDDESIYFFDRAADTHDNNNSLYFTNQGWAGGLVFALWKKEVRQFLIDNANFFVDEYHVDGFRYDEVSVIIHKSNDGWGFCQHLTDTIRFQDPTAVQISEYWPVDYYTVKGRGEGGAGFDSTWHDGLRNTIRGVISQAAGGRDGRIYLDDLAATLEIPSTWKAVQSIEDHDIVHNDHPIRTRIPKLSDNSNPRSWYGKSRARVATGLLLTAPGIPMIFMGQEFLEDKAWNDNSGYAPGSLIWWEGLHAGDKPMADHHRFTQDLIWLRRRHPALRSNNTNVFHVHNDNRVIAFHRWMNNGRDVIVVASLNESTFYGYQLGMPASGRWLEVFNSDIYENWVNPQTAGNGGEINAEGPAMHGFSHSADIVIPANSIIVFSRDNGDF